MLTSPPAGIPADPSLVRIRPLTRFQETEDVLGREEMSYSEIESYRGHTELFSDLTAWTRSSAVFDPDGAALTALTVEASYVEDGYFDLLRVVPALGGVPRSRDPADVPVVMLSDFFWRQQFGSDPGVLGRTIRLNDVPVTVVGVAPPSFEGIDSFSDLVVWLPLLAREVVESGTSSAASNPDSVDYRAVARLRPGIDPERATRELRAFGLPFGDPIPQDPSERVRDIDVVPLRATNATPTSYRGMASEVAVAGFFSFLLLLITCTNVSGLLVGLAVSRRREIGVRLALGASRRRLIRQLVTESALLATAGGILALGAIRLLLGYFAALTQLEREVQLTIAWPIATLTLLGGCGSGLLFGLTPAFHATRVALSDALKDAAAAIVASKSRLHQALVVSQVAFTVPLLVVLAAGGLLVIDEWRGRPLPTLHEYLVTLEFRNATGTPEARAEAMRRLRERLEGLSAVTAVVPQSLAYPIGYRQVHPEDRSSVTPTRTLILQREFASLGYFEVMEIPFLRGRDFDEFERDVESPSVVIGSDLANELWGEEDPIGKRLVRVNGAEAGEVSEVVVGVVDAKSAGSSRQGNRRRVYVPDGALGSGVLVRTSGPAEPLIPILASVARSEVPDMALTRIESLAAVDRRERSVLLRASLSVAAGAILALFLSAIGLYALIAFTVTARTREIGVRLALGAGRKRIVGSFILRGATLCAVGMAFGFPLGLFGLRLAVVQIGLPEVSGSAGVSLVVASVLFLVTVAATLHPAVRAARLDPAQILKGE